MPDEPRHAPKAAIARAMTASGRRMGNGRDGWVMEEKKADVFITYCTKAVLAQKEVQSLKVVRIPEDLSVGADYGLVVRNGATSQAWQLAMYILSPDGQKILRKYGFEASAMANEE